MKHLVWWTVPFACAGGINTAIAQVVVPGDVDPGRAIIPQQALPQSQAAPAIDLFNQGLPKELADQEVFDVHSITIRVVGNSTVFSQAELDALAAPLLSKKNISASDVELLQKTLQREYQLKGFALLRLRPPKYALVGDEAAVLLEVIEGYIASVTWPDTVTDRTNVLPALTRALLEERPISMDTYLRYVQIAKTLPGQQLKPVSDKSETAGAFRLEFTSENASPWRVWAQVDNRGTESSGPIQLSAGAELNNTLGLHETLTVQYAGTIDFGELHYGSLGYKQVLNSEGTTLNVSASYNEGDPGTQILDQLDFRSDGLTVNVDLSHPLIASADFSLWAFGGLDLSRICAAPLTT